MTKIEIIFTFHALEKIKERTIKLPQIEMTILNPEELYFDKENGTYVAIRQFSSRWIVVIYIEIPHAHKKIFKVVTTYFTKKKDKLVKSKLRQDAWRKLKQSQRFGMIQRPISFTFIIETA